MMLAFGIALTTINVPGITAGTMVAGWAFLSICLPLMIAARTNMTEGHWIGIAFLAYVAASLAWTSNWLSGVETLWHWGVIAAAFMLGHRMTSLRNLFIGISLGLCVSGIVGAFQLAGFAPVASLSPGVFTGLFYNPNMLGETAAIALVALIVYRVDWLALPVAAIMVLSQSRAALIGVVVAGVMMTRHRFIAMLALLTACAGAFALKDGSHALIVRYEALQEAAKSLTWIGNGAGSFIVTTPRATFEHLHNDWIELIYEYGIGSALVFAVVIGAMLRADRHGPVLLCFVVIACFSFPTFLPVTSFMAAIVAGHMYRYRTMVWDYSVWRRHHIDARLAAR